jgi:hypothetical protein
MTKDALVEYLNNYAKNRGGLIYRVDTIAILSGDTAHETYKKYQAKQLPVAEKFFRTIGFQIDKADTCWDFVADSKTIIAAIYGHCRSVPPKTAFDAGPERI